MSDLPTLGQQVGLEDPQSGGRKISDWHNLYPISVYNYNMQLLKHNLPNNLPLFKSKNVITNIHLVVLYINIGQIIILNMRPRTIKACSVLLT